LNQLEIIK